jgi:two-component system alkaline phosphatase synthesis response regulator PhoP
MTTRILVVDDEAKIVKTVRAYLESSGYTVSTAADGQTALAAFRHEHPGLVILDLGLPGLDGLDVTKAIRHESDVPIIILTARVEETDKLVGLELGADDYVTKPFSPRELVARVRALLRRASGKKEALQTPIIAGDLTIDPVRRAVQVGREWADLTATEFDLLWVLAENPGRVFTRLELLDKTQGYAYEGYERTIDVHVKNLRRKLETSPQKSHYIMTVYGVGYKFNEDLNE